MKYIKELESKGFQRRYIVDFLIGAAQDRKLTIDERIYIANYIIDLEKFIPNESKTVNRNEQKEKVICSTCGSDDYTDWNTYYRCNECDSKF